MVMQLEWDVMPKTCENFRAMCTGDKGPKYHYKGRAFHKIMPGIALQGVPGVASIYGFQFADEGFTLKHSEEGVCVCVCGQHCFESEYRVGEFNCMDRVSAERPVDRAAGGWTTCRGAGGCH